MVRNNWSQIVVAGCTLHYFVLDRFGSFSTAKRSKAAMKRFRSYENSYHDVYSKETKQF